MIDVEDLRSANERSDTQTRDFVSILIVLAKKKRFLTVFPLIVAIIAAVVSLTLPNVYRGAAVLLPPQQQQSSAAALLSQLGGVAGVAAGVTGLKNPNDLYVGMLGSRTIADKLVEKFNLVKVYGSDTTEQARRELDNNTQITSGKDGLITIEVIDKNQKLVAPMANAYVAELLSLTKQLALTESSQRRKFFEDQLGLAKDNLAKAEVTLKHGLETKGVVSVDVDSQAIVETIARLRAQVSAKEIEINSMSSFVTTSNQDYRRANEELRSLRDQLTKLQNGAASEDEKPGNQSGLENIKTLRDVKYYQMLYEILAKQYEVARLDEAKEASVIQVLDAAVEPERKFKPARAIIVILSAIVASIMAVIWILLIDARDRFRALPAGRAQWDEMASHLSLKKGK
jgi:tyrosine-protein kinase Etk/Wzc